MNKFIISESEKQRILEMHQNATSRQYLNEDSDNYSIELTVTVPMMTNTSGQEVFDKSRMVVVKATNYGGEGGMDTLNLYKSIANIKIDEFKPIGRAIGNNTYQFMASDTKLQNFLVGNIGKNYQDPETSYSNVTMNLVAGGQKPYNATVKYVKSVTPAQK